MAKKWYVIQTYSGYEAKVKSGLQERIKQYEMTDSFGVHRDGDERKDLAFGQGDESGDGVHREPESDSGQSA